MDLLINKHGRLMEEAPCTDKNLIEDAPCTDKILIEDAPCTDKNTKIRRSPTLLLLLPTSYLCSTPVQRPD